MGAFKTEYFENLGQKGLRYGDGWEGRYVVFKCLAYFQILQLLL